MDKTLLCIGHTTFDSFMMVDDVEIYCDINSHKCTVGFGFGAKIPVTKVYEGLGGGACNVSVGTSRLGIKTYLYTYIGTDYEGEFAKIMLRKKQVLQNYIFQDDKSTNRSNIISYEVDRTIFIYKEPRKFSISPEFSDFSNIFVCSTGKDVTTLYDDLIELNKEKNAKIFFNPGTLELKHSRGEVLRFLMHIDTLLLNLDELELLLNITNAKKDNESINHMFNQVFDLGVKTVVVTDGPNGVFAMSKDGSLEDKVFTHFAPPNAKVVEKTGAGDAFSSGFISARLNDKSIKESCLWGAKNSASVIQIIGSQDGLLDLEQILH